MRTRGTPETHFTGAAHAATDGTGRLVKTRDTIQAGIVPYVHPLNFAAFSASEIVVFTDNGFFAFLSVSTGSRVYYGTNPLLPSASTSVTGNFSNGLAFNPARTELMIASNANNNFEYSVDGGVTLGSRMAPISSNWAAYYFDGQFLMVDTTANAAYKYTSPTATPTVDGEVKVGARTVKGEYFLILETGTGTVWFKSTYGGTLNSVVLTGFTTANFVAWDVNSRQFAVLESSTQKLAILDKNLVVVQYSTVPASDALTGMAWDHGYLWFHTVNGGKTGIYFSGNMINWQIIPFGKTIQYPIVAGDGSLVLMSSRDGYPYWIHPFYSTQAVTE